MIRLQTVGFRELERELAANAGELIRELGPALEYAGDILRRSMAAQIGAGGPGRLRNRSGNLRDSINRSKFKPDRRGGGAVFVGPYGNPKVNLLRVHEQGLTVAYKRGRFAGRVARYPRRPVIAPAVAQSTEKVYREISNRVRIIGPRIL